MEHILIIGGGIGGAIAHDLTQRGYSVTLFEKGELLSGSTGRHHGLLHSGARYALHDVETARECFLENQILRRIAPQGLEQNDGLFVAIEDEDMAYRERFLERCRTAGIPVKELSPARALLMEPALNPRLKAAVQVPDATMDAWRLGLHFFASALNAGARIFPFHEVMAINCTGRKAHEVVVHDHTTHKTHRIQGDIIVNAAGPWAGKIAAKLDLSLPVTPGPGVMVSVKKRLTHMVINRLHPAGEGDILVPQRNLSILGTTVWLADDPDQVNLPPEHVQQIIENGTLLVPLVAEVPLHAAWCASRPLVEAFDDKTDPMKSSRSFICLDHARQDGIEGLISIVGGKATTMRAMAEHVADMVNAKTGRDIPCRTHHTPLAHYRQFCRSRYASMPP